MGMIIEYESTDLNSSLISDTSPKATYLPLLSRGAKMRSICWTRCFRWGVLRRFENLHMKISTTRLVSSFDHWYYIRFNQRLCVVHSMHLP